MTQSKSKEIRSLFSVLGGGVLFACLSVVFFIYFYGPTGKSLAGNLILNPGVLKELKYIDDSSGERKEYVLDQINFHFFDEQKKKWGSLPLNLQEYQSFYDSIAKDSSLDENEVPIKQLSEGSIATLTVTLRPEDLSNNAQKKVIQQILFSTDGNYYQIETNHKNLQSHYFYHSKVYHTILTQITNKGSNL